MRKSPQNMIYQREYSNFYASRKERRPTRNSKLRSRMAALLPRAPGKRITRFLILAFILLSVFFIYHDGFETIRYKHNLIATPSQPEQYPVPPAERISLPRGRSANIPRIQHVFKKETSAEKKVRVARLTEVREHFIHAWEGYKKEAWGEDELRPLQGGFKTPFCGWAATLVDSLDTLLIMGLNDEFQLALKVVEKLDFMHTQGCQINLFETTIRHLGGLLSAYDLSAGKHKILIVKAVELAEVLYTGFDTPNRMPSPHYMWSWNNTQANDHQPSTSVVVAVLGTLSLEFTRLAQITGNNKYYDAIQRVMNEMEAWQPKNLLPGMWPTNADTTSMNQTSLLASTFPTLETYTLGSLADSAYEYLPKQFIMLGGRLKQYQTMYETFVEVAQKYLFFRPMTVNEEDILIAGSTTIAEGQPPKHMPELEHLTCFVGGMLAIAGKIFNRPKDVEDGGRLADGCVWAYKNTPSGIMPERFQAVPCKSREECKWDPQAWYDSVAPNEDESRIRETIKNQNLAAGFAKINDGRYLLRPEAIESVFIMHRVTGNPHWQESGWHMWRSIAAHTKTALAHSAIENVMTPVPQHVDEMESFWLAETLKYFYLLYSQPTVVSLDDYVLNTEAHPLRRPA